MRQPAQPAEYKNPAHRLSAFVVLLLAFAVLLAAVLTILLFGWPVIWYGVPTCGVLIENHMLDRIFYTSCGCAVVEILLLGLCIPALGVVIPRLWRHGRFYSALRPGISKRPQDRL